MPKVYIVQEPLIRRNGDDRPEHKYSLEPARKFGELVVVTQWKDARPPVDVSRLTEMLYERLSPFTADDFLLLAGNPGLIAMAAVVAASYTGGLVKLLVWDRQEQDYHLWATDIDIHDYEGTQP